MSSRLPDSIRCCSSPGGKKKKEEKEQAEWTSPLGHHFVEVTNYIAHCIPLTNEILSPFLITVEDIVSPLRFLPASPGILNQERLAPFAGPH
ncbi:hypothetical protein chiPu_0022416 [Chiloscyllium punctatum]|uniref:Uncharacterized protein n=1 Tax=Chiloscyllium punctatum TaxID=137246 RepID=A0A401RDV8_CHIPU|nr:hypothetical protein [Chiloscyllium punctatum]